MSNNIMSNKTKVSNLGPQSSGDKKMDKVVKTKLISLMREARYDELRDISSALLNTIYYLKTTNHTKAKKLNRALLIVNQVLDEIHDLPICD